MSVLIKHALLLTAAVRMAEVSGLKRKLGQTEEELRLSKKHLEANRGEKNPRPYVV